MSPSTNHTFNYAPFSHLWLVQAIVGEADLHLRRQAVPHLLLHLAFFIHLGRREGCAIGAKPREVLLSFFVDLSALS